MNKKHAFQVVEKKLAELLSSDDLRERVTQLLAEDENGYISKIDLTEYVDKKENGEALYVPRGGGEPLDPLKEPSYHFSAGALYECDETKRLIRVWFEIYDDESFNISTISRSELLNAEDLSIYDPSIMNEGTASRTEKNKLKEVFSGVKSVTMKIVDRYKIKKTACRIAEAKLQEVLSGGNARIVNIFNNYEVDFPVEDGFEYQVDIFAYYGKRDKERKKIEVMVDVDYGGMWGCVKRRFINADELRAWKREHNSGAKKRKQIQV